jgi:HK97 family phage major capsid protein
MAVPSGYSARQATPNRRPPQGGSTPPPPPGGNGPRTAQGYSPLGRSFSGFIKAVQRQDAGTLAHLYDADYTVGVTRGVTKAAMGENTGTAGGYLVPIEYTLKLMEVLTEDSFIYQRANVIPMKGVEVRAPYIDVETVPIATATSPVFGGITFGWGSEDVPLETEPRFRQQTLRAWDLLGYAVLDNQFVEDVGPEGDDYLLKLFGRAAAWYAEYAFLQGTGAGSLMPMGVLNGPAVLTVTRAAPTAISAPDIANMAASLLPFSWKSSIWAVSPTCLGQLIKISNFFMNQATDQSQLEKAGGSGAIMTRPMFVTEKLPPLGTQGDMILFDPRLYVIGDRMQVLIDASTHDAFRSNQTVFRIWLRMDGRPMVSGKITLQDKTTVVSPYVVLK